MMRAQAPISLESDTTLPPRWASALWPLLLDYVALTKPRIISLLLVTALGGMFLAEQGVPSTGLILLVFLGGSLGAGGANALNHYLDRDIDQLMTRTAGRPLPGKRLDPRNAMLFGVALNALAFIVLGVWVNLLAAGLTVGATLFYVLIYTSWLKRTTTQNIVIGGAAGAVPPVVGWAAVTGGLDLPALYLFAIVFFWTPPHFWALSMLIRSDYAQAGIPMLPVVVGDRDTARSIMLHSLTLVALTLLFFTVEQLGWVYLSGALGLGAAFLYGAWRVLRIGARIDVLRLYLYSLLYLAILFLFIMVDSAA